MGSGRIKIEERRHNRIVKGHKVAQHEVEVDHYVLVVLRMLVIIGAKQNIDIVRPY